MKNKMLLGLEELIYGKVYGTKDHNLEIYNVQSRNRYEKFDYCKGDFIVTSKGYLLKGFDEALRKEKATLLIGNPMFLRYENGHICYVIKNLGRLRLVDTITPVNEKPKILAESRFCLA